MTEQQQPQVTGRAERIVYPPNPRLERLRFLANLLDTCITLPGGYRIGLDPILGLVPGVGDVIGAGLSLYLVREAANLGIPKWNRLPDARECRYRGPYWSRSCFRGRLRCGL